MKFVIHFLIGTVAASSIIAFNFTGFNVLPYFLKNMTLTETLSSSYSATPSITPFVENSTAILNSTNVTIAPPLLNITNATRRPLNATNPPTNARRTPLNTRRISLNPTNSARRTPLNPTNSARRTPSNATNSPTKPPTNIPSLNATNSSTKPPRHSYLRYSRSPTKTKTKTSTPSRTSKYSQ